MRLLVFETDQLEKEYVLNNNLKDKVNTGSLQRGAGSIACTLKNGEVYDTVLFIKNNYFNGDYAEHVNKLYWFTIELKRYKLINEDTNLI